MWWCIIAIIIALIVAIFWLLCRVVRKYVKNCKERKP